MMQRHAAASTGRALRRLGRSSAAAAVAAPAPLRPLMNGAASLLARQQSPPLLGTRALASSSAVDSYSSSGVIIDPYVDYHYKEKAAAAAPIYSLDALRTKVEGVKSKLSSGVSFGHIRRHVKAFNLKSFGKEAQGIFQDFHDAFEKGDVRRLAALCTEDLFLNLKAQIKTKRGRETRRVLRFISFTQPTIIVHGRHLYTSGGRGIRTQTGYGQVTVVISSRREEFDVDGKGQRIATPSKAAGKGAAGVATVRPPAIFDNESICVFEVAFSDPKGRWRLASIVEEERKTDPVASSMATEPVGL